MSTVLEELETIYSVYLDTMARLEQRSASANGLFRSMFGAGPGNDICNEQFAEGVKGCIDGFSATEPNSAETLVVMDYVLSRGSDGSAGLRAKAMLEAVQGYLLPLAAYLSAEDAQELMDRYYDKRAAKRLMPAQKKVMLAIKEKSKK